MMRRNGSLLILDQTVSEQILIDQFNDTAISNPANVGDIPLNNKRDT